MIDRSPPRRSRLWCSALILLVVCAGLLCRSHYVNLPPFWAKYTGDALWAVMVFLITGWLLRCKPTLAVAGIALLFCFLIEFSQLYRGAWLVSVRHTFVGHLVLGDTFAWADIAAYCVGILLAMVAEGLLSRVRSRRPGRQKARVD